MPDRLQTFLDRLAQNGRPVVVDFWAPWCGPCRAIESSMKRLEQTYHGQVDVWRVNADEQPDLLRQLKVYGIPTLIAFQDGQEIARQTGAQPQASLARLFEAALSGERPAKASLSWGNRLFRLAAGVALFILAYSENFSGVYLVFGLVGAGVMLSGIPINCPIVNAISARVGELFQRKSDSQAR